MAVGLAIRVSFIFNRNSRIASPVTVTLCVPLRLEVVISRPPHGVRSAGLQHFFVKRRAVEFPPLLQKLLNK